MQFYIKADLRFFKYWFLSEKLMIIGKWQKSINKRSIFVEYISYKKYSKFGLSINEIRIWWFFAIDLIALFTQKGVSLLSTLQ